jgi:hypothetical protein
MLKDGGPIEILKISLAGDFAQGPGQFTALAKLKPEHRNVAADSSFKLYSTYDGTGTADSESEACNKAISEALERWAFYSLSENASKTLAPGGILVCPTTEGFAAFPGLFSSSARKNAFNEAVERWALKQWWGGRLPSKVIEISTRSIDGFEIFTPFTSCKIVVLFAKIPETELVAYGFAASNSILRAIERAKTELFRNFFVLGKDAEPGSINNQTVENIYEKRALFFSTPRGHEIFRKKIFQSLKIPESNTLPKTLVDEAIPGPWSRYASVWRVLFETEFEEWRFGDDFFYF